MLTIVNKFYIEADVLSYEQNTELQLAFKERDIFIKEVYSEKTEDSNYTIVYRISTNYPDQSEFIKNLLDLFKEYDNYNLRFASYEEIV